MNRYFVLLTLLTTLLGGCASIDGLGLKPGIATEMDVRHLMGEPSQEWSEADGGKALAYPRGPIALQTFMVRLDKNARLVVIDQVLNDKHFNKIQPGFNETQVTRLIGPPYQIIPFKRKQEIAWDYRYQDDWGYSSVFSVIFDETGTVKTTVRTREERRYPFQPF